MHEKIGTNCATMEELEKYISGLLKGNERLDFEQKIADDPELQTELQLREGLRQLRWHAKTEQVEITRKRMLRQRFGRFLGFCVLLGGLVISLVIYFSNLYVKDIPIQGEPKNLSDKTAPNQQPKIEQNKEVLKPSNITPKKKKRYTGPIAEVTPDEMISPLYPAPNIRGENTENPTWQALLDKIWYTDYPLSGTELGTPFKPVGELLKKRDFSNAFVRLKRLETKLPANDTLRLLKSYCLLEMGEGTEALVSFEGLEVRQPNWIPQLQWLRGLALLISGEKEKAIVQFREIAAQPQHPYRLQSERAIKLLKQ